MLVLRLVAQMKRYLTIDVYGHCGTLQCPRDEHVKCLNMLSNEYKFYLAFENSLCQDYVTEKFFGVTKYKIIAF